MKIFKKYIGLVICLALLTAFLPLTTYAQVVYKGINSATAKGTALGKEVSDNSNSGTTITRLNDDPTQIDFPMIGLSKTVGTPALQANGTYNVTYTLRVQNYSTISLNNVQIIDELENIFSNDVNNAAFTMVGQVTKLASNATNGTGAITVNTGFNGDGDKNLLVSTSSSLIPTLTEVLPSRTPKQYEVTGSEHFATIRFTINIDPRGKSAAYKTYNNTATVSASTMTSDVVAVNDVSHNNASPNQGNNARTPLFYNTPTPVTLSNAVALRITKTSNTVGGKYTPGNTVVYTVTATNTGPYHAIDANVTDNMPTGTTGTWTAVYSSGASGVVAGGTIAGVGNINQTVTIPSGGTITYTVTLTVPSSFTGNLVNTATITKPDATTETVTTDNSATVTDTQDSKADLKITNTDGKATYTPGTTNTYTIVVTNDGPSDVTGATVTNTLPTGFVGATWTAVYTGSATGTASGTGSISESVNMPAGSTVTYTYVVNVPSSYTGNYVNTATVTAPSGVTDATLGNNTATDTDTQDSEVALAITKISNTVLSKYVPGTSVVYTVTATNTGPSDAIGANVTDNMPTGGTGTWTAVYSTGASGVVAGGTTAGVGNINQTVTIPKDGSITYTVTLATASSRTGDLVNTATITKPATAKETLTTDNSASVTDTQDSEVALKITKTSNTNNVAGKYVPGTSVVYTVTATNAGPSDAIGANVTDNMPTGGTGTWTAVYSTGASGVAAGGTTTGTGNINQTVTIPSGGTITYTVTLAVASSRTGDLVNTATITKPATARETLTTDNTVTVTDTKDSRADLKITNTDGKTKFVPGTNNVYTITVDNVGPSDVIGAVIANALPTGVTVSSWTAVGSGGVVLNAASGNGAINQTEDIPSGGKIVYTVTMAIPSGRTADVVSVATVTAPVGVTDPTPANNSSTDTDTTDKIADLKITNTDGKTQYTPGTSNTYTIVVTNDGPSDVTGATVTNTLPTGFTGATWTAVYSTSAAGTATGAASGTGSISELVDMPTGTTITYTYTVNVPSGYTGNYTNTATVKAPVGVKNSSNVDAASVSASDTDTQNSIVDLKVEKVADVMNPIVTNNIKFTIKVTNVGPSDGSGVTVTDKLNPGYTFVSATPSVGTYDPITGVWTIGALTYNQSVTLDVIATVLPDKTAANYENTATVAGTENDPVTTNNTVTISPVPRQLIDLKISKIVDITSPEVGTEIAFTLAVENIGPSNATNVIVNDLLKAGYTYSSSTPSIGTYNPATGIWTIGNLAVGAKVQMVVRAIVNANEDATDYVNTAVASGAELEQILPNNTATVSSVTPIPIADLAIVKVASMLSPSVNTNIAFTLTATNNGLSNATGVSVTDLLTAGFRFVSATASVGTYNQTTGIWNIGSLNLGTTASLTINAIVNENGPYVNTATITGTESDRNLTNNTSTVVLTTQATPVAVDDVVKACSVGPVVIDILANDLKSVSNINPSTVVVTKQPTNGSVTIDLTTGKATYTPRAGYTGDDQFSYTVKDINGGTSNEAQVKITVNQAIVALNDLASTDPNLPVVIDILANDMVGSTAIVPGSIVITQQPVNGTITIDAAGKVTYTPKNNYVGTDSFKYTVKDVSGCTSNVATVDIRMNDLPKIGLAKAATSVAKQQNGSYNITYQFVVGNYGTSVLSNVSIKDDLRITFKGDAFSVKSVTSSGTLRVNPQYNGGSVVELLAAGNSLAVGDKQQLEIVVNVVVGSDQVTYLNSAIAEGSSITGIKNTDVSTDGLVPDANGDVSSSVPTPVDLSRPKQFIPEGFSPNGDGINDTFVIANAGNKRVSLEIYNRWANRVYRSADYKNDWSGQSNEGIRISGDLPEGTYFYIVVIDGKDKYVGSITLKR